MMPAAIRFFRITALISSSLEMKELFKLSQTGMEILPAIFFSAASYLDLGGA